MSTSDKIRYGFGFFLLGLCLVVAIIYFTQASRDLERNEQQVQQLKQIQHEAQVKAQLGPRTDKQTKL